MIVIFGLYFLLLGIILDDLTTLIVFWKGYGIMETNPLYLHFGFVGMILMMVIFYLLIISSWFFVNKAYINLYKNKKKVWKLYDVFIFMFCLIIVYLSVIKCEAGLNNLQIIKSINNKDANIIEFKDTLEEIKTNNATQHIENAKEYYNNHTAYLSYFKMLFINLIAYLLFRSGYKVSLYEY